MYSKPSDHHLDPHPYPMIQNPVHVSPLLSLALLQAGPGQQSTPHITLNVLCYGPTQLGLHTTYNLQRTTYNVQPTTYHLQRTNYNVQPTTYRVHYPKHNVLLSTPPSTNATTWLHCTQHNGSLALSPTQCTAHNVLSLPFLPFSPQRTSHNVNAQCNYTL
jgi:hypothetical protein